MLEIYSTYHKMAFIDYSNAPADESQQEEWFEEELTKYVNNIKKEFIHSKKKADYDLILKKYNIKMMKNGKLSSPMQMKMDIKRKIIKFAIEEPEDIFDYDHYSKAA